MLERRADQLSALGNPLRLEILRYVVSRTPDQVCVSHIQTRVKIPNSTLSHHLKRLIQSGLMAFVADGTRHYYTANYDALKSLTEYVWRDCCADGKACDVPRQPPCVSPSGERGEPSA